MIPDPPTDPHPEALDALHRVFGFAALKPGQAEVVGAVLAGRGLVLLRLAAKNLRSSPVLTALPCHKAPTQ